jgi:hypothetical protein
MRPICGLRSSFPVGTEALEDRNFPVTSPQSLRLVLLEDDAFTLMTLAALVRSLGHQVVAQTSTIVDAIDCARTHRLDVAILEVDYCRSAADSYYLRLIWNFLIAAFVIVFVVPRAVHAPLIIFALLSLFSR